MDIHPALTKLSSCKGTINYGTSHELPLYNKCSDLDVLLKNMQTMVQQGHDRYINDVGETCYIHKSDSRSTTVKCFHHDFTIDEFYEKTYTIER